MSKTKVKIKVSDHVRVRCKQCNIRVGYLIKEISPLPNVQGKLRWMTDKGVIIIERVNEGLILIKTFIARFKYKGKNYRKGCMTF